MKFVWGSEEVKSKGNQIKKMYDSIVTVLYSYELGSSLKAFLLLMCFSCSSFRRVKCRGPSSVVTNIMSFKSSYIIASYLPLPSFEDQKFLIVHFSFRGFEFFFIESESLNASLNCD